MSVAEKKVLFIPRNHRSVFHAAAKEDGQLFVSESKHGLVAYTRYWIAPIAAAAELLDWWNLPEKPGRYEVGQRVRYVDEKTPPVDKLLPDTKTGDELTSRTFGKRGLAVRVMHRGLIHLVVDPHEIMLRTSYLDAIAPAWERDEVLTFHSIGRSQPAHLWRGEEFAGVLMGVRHW